MKTRKLSLLALALLMSAGLTAQTKINHTKEWKEIGAYNSMGIAVDVDNDGYRDLVYGGISDNRIYRAGTNDVERNRLTHVMQYLPGSRQLDVTNYFGPTFPDQGIGLNVADRPSISACDINQDGIMDLVVFETSGLKYNDEPMLDRISREGVFLGNGDGTFSKAILSFVDTAGNPIDFDLSVILSADVADFNNDGLIDIVGIGYQQNPLGSKQYPTANVVLINQGSGTFMVTHFLTDSYTTAYGQEGLDYHFQMGQVTCYDFNNDGYADFFINAQSDDAAVLGVRIPSTTHFSDLFLNDPEHPGQFRRQYIYDSTRWTTIFEHISEGGIAVADFDNDGVPDIFYSGWGYRGRMRYFWGLYTCSLDESGRVTLTDRGHEGIEEMRNQNSTNAQYVAYDWDGDGNYDIINAGWSTRLSTQTCFVSIGDGQAGFESAYRLAGYSEGATVIVDWNGDGVGDYVMIGQTDDDEFFPTNGLTKTFAATVNPNAKAARPDAPSLKTPGIDGNKVTLSWADAPSSKRNVTYEYFVRDEASGRIVAGGNSFVGGEKDGVRKVNQAGNAYNARSITLTLPQGRYTYGVQTVNARLEGSVFATGSFEILSGNAPERSADMPAKHEPIVNEEDCGYVGPVIDRDAPDPTVIRGDDGYYYLFSTEAVRNVPIYRSKNLVDWDFIGTAFTDGTRPNFVTNGGIWAPDIQHFGNYYQLYFSMSTWGGEWACGIGVAIATKPEGPYRGARKLFISSEIGVQNSIDPFVIEDDGHKYLFWGSFRGIYGIELANNGLSVKDGAEKKQIAGTLTEGTYIIKHDGYYYLIGSAGSCCNGENATYHVVMARSENLFGPYVNKLGSQALSNGFSNLLYRNDDVIGPGHNANFVQDDAGQWWMLYHGYDASDVGAGRKTFLARIDWDEEGWPYVKNAQPTNGDACPLIGEKYSGIAYPTVTDDREDKTVSVYPHYVKRDITITHASGEEFEWQVVNLHGELTAKGKAKGTATVDLYAVPTGMYIVTVNSPNGLHSEKVIRY
ncbi:MAG: family 43 glycosylhydrolase [Prevotella sp.]|nr:family 43 glycosylhydrolase [Prevotella sp.]